jgi:hypothetical protein
MDPDGTRRRTDKIVATSFAGNAQPAGPHGRDPPKLSSSCATAVIARRADSGRTTSIVAVVYCASTQVSDPVSLTATFVKKIRAGLPSAVPRWSVEKSRGPAFL